MITRILLHNFKSYGTTTHLDFLPGFTSIVGLNGSGKSNILDSVSFCLCHPISTLRATHYRDIIGCDGNECRVTIYLKSNGRDVSFTRTVNVHNQCMYFVDGEKVGVVEYRNALVNSFLVPSFFVVFQDDVGRLVQSNNLTGLFEDISGYVEKGEYLMVDSVYETIYGKDLGDLGIDEEGSVTCNKEDTRWSKDIRNLSIDENISMNKKYTRHGKDITNLSINENISTNKDDTRWSKDLRDLGINENISTNKNDTRHGKDIRDLSINENKSMNKNNKERTSPKYINLKTLFEETTKQYQHYHNIFKKHSNTRQIYQIEIKKEKELLYMNQKIKRLLKDKENVVQCFYLSELRDIKNEIENNKKFILEMEGMKDNVIRKEYDVDSLMMKGICKDINKDNTINNNKEIIKDNCVSINKDNMKYYNKEIIKDNCVSFNKDNMKYYNKEINKGNCVSINKDNIINNNKEIIKDFSEDISKYIKKYITGLKQDLALQQQNILLKEKELEDLQERQKRYAMIKIEKEMKEGKEKNKYDKISELNKKIEEKKIGIILLKKEMKNIEGAYSNFIKENTEKYNASLLKKNDESIKENIDAENISLVKNNQLINNDAENISLIKNNQLVNNNAENTSLVKPNDEYIIENEDPLFTQLESIYLEKTSNLQDLLMSYQINIKPKKDTLESHQKNIQIIINDIKKHETEQDNHKKIIQDMENSMKDNSMNIISIQDKMNQKETVFDPPTKDILSDLELYTNLTKEEKDINNILSSLLTEIDRSKTYSKTQKKRIVLCNIIEEMKTHFNCADSNYNTKVLESSKVLGRLGDLVYPIKDKYTKPLSSLLSNYIDAIVVRNESVAVECVEYLKKRKMGYATFLPLNSLRKYVNNKDYRVFNDFNDENNSNRKKSVGNEYVYAIDTLNFESVIRPAIESILGDDIICDSIKDAKVLKYTKNVKSKICTLNNVLFNKNNTITGGNSAYESINNYFKRENNDNKNSAIYESTNRFFKGDNKVANKNNSGCEHTNNYCKRENNGNKNNAIYESINNYCQKENNDNKVANKNNSGCEPTNNYFKRENNDNKNNAIYEPTNNYSKKENNDAGFTNIQALLEQKNNLINQLKEINHKKSCLVHIEISFQKINELKHKNNILNHEIQEKRKIINTLENKTKLLKNKQNEHEKCVYNINNEINEISIKMEVITQKLSLAIQSVFKNSSFVVGNKKIQVVAYADMQKYYNMRNKEKNKAAEYENMYYKEKSRVERKICVVEKEIEEIKNELEMVADEIRSGVDKNYGYVQDMDEYQIKRCISTIHNEITILRDVFLKNKKVFDNERMKYGNVMEKINDIERDVIVCRARVDELYENCGKVLRKMEDESVNVPLIKEKDNNEMDDKDFNNSLINQNFKRDESGNFNLMNKDFKRDEGNNNNSLINQNFKRDESGNKNLTNKDFKRDEGNNNNSFINQNSKRDESGNKNLMNKDFKRDEGNNNNSLINQNENNKRDNININDKEGNSTIMNRKDKREYGNNKEDGKYQDMQYRISSMNITEESNYKLEKIDFSKLTLQSTEYKEKLKKINQEIESIAGSSCKNKPNKSIHKNYEIACIEYEESRKEMLKSRQNMVEIKKIRTERFLDCITIINNNLSEVYKNLTNPCAENKSDINNITTQNENKCHTNAYLIIENTLDPFMSKTKYFIMPPNKRYREIHYLSGGEKTMGIFALIFAINKFKKAPFIIIDEMDAALDKENYRKLVEYIKESTRTESGNQVVAISLKSGVYGEADALVGIYKVKGKSHVLTYKLDD